jgi:hypothetical protein
MRLITKLRRAPARSSALVLPVLASAPSVTGRVKGVLTLPVPVEWSQRVLPAGGYVFVVSPAPSRSWVYLQGNEDASVFFAAANEPASGAPRSEIALLYDGRRYHVRSLTLRESGRTLLFDVQRAEPAEPGEKRWPGVLYVLLQPFVEPHPNSTSDPWRPR